MNTQSESHDKQNQNQISISEIRFEHRRHPLGIGTGQPRLSWIIQSDLQNWKQTHYQVEAFDDKGELVAATDWIESDRSFLVPWPFDPLHSRQSLVIRVRVWGSDRSRSQWSALARVEAGLLSASDWGAQFITPGWEEDPAIPQDAPLFRREFTVRTGLQKARLYVTALGLFEMEINGAVVGDQVLAPGWTSYHHRLCYQTFDITHLLNPGENAVGGILGEGWYLGRIGFDGGVKNIWGDKLALLAQIELYYEDGTVEKILTDERWRCSKSPIIMNSLYDGETYDALLEQPGWSEPGFDDHGWGKVNPIEHDLSTMVAPDGPPVRRVQTLQPQEILTSPSGKTILDFGQNLVGRLRIHVSGEAGREITIKHSEVLEAGELCLWPLRSAKATDRYILKGVDEETWEPRFTFHGFRYAQVEGWPGKLLPDDIQGVVLHSDLERRGWFDSSDPRLNRFHENVVWSMRGNFLSIPTDCPQRDERLGWTGDLQVFAPTASFLYDVSGFLSSWLKDLACDQGDHQGIVPYFVPNTLPHATPAAAWGDAATVVPWVLYQRYGDVQILERQYESMQAWVNLIDQIAGENHLWDSGFQFGDWLEPSAPTHNPAGGRTDKTIVASAYFAHSTEILAQTAKILGCDQDETHYRQLAQDIRHAFSQEYLTPAGRIMSDTPTAYSLAIQFALLPTQEQRRHAGEQLAKLVRGSDHRINTGFVGTPLICDALCTTGYYEDAFRLLMQSDLPSWLYPVRMGATTIWERWDSILLDGTINQSGMLSFNHYAFGAVADWMHRILGGIAPAEPGYRQIAFSPVPYQGLTHASVKHKTPYGIAEGGWAWEGNQVRYHLTVPPNASAMVRLPEDGWEPLQVGSGDYQWRFTRSRQMAVKKAWTLEHTVGDLMVDPQAKKQLIDILSRFIPELEHRIGDMGDYSTLTLKALSFLIPNGEELLQTLEVELLRSESG